MSMTIDFDVLRERLESMADRLAGTSEPSGQRRARLLHERARLLAKVVGDDSPGTRLPGWLLARRGTAHFAYPLADLLAVITCPPIVPMQGRRPGQRGLLNYRGRFWAATEAPAAELQGIATDGGQFAMLLRSDARIAVICDDVVGIAALSGASAETSDAGTRTVIYNGKSLRLCALNESLPTTHSGYANDADN